MRVNLCLSILTLCSLSCSDNSSFVPVSEESNYIIHASDRLLKTNDSTQIIIESHDDMDANLHYAWTSNMGIIKGNSKKAIFKSLSNKGSAIIRIKIMTDTQIVFEDSISILIYKQLVFLKADDLSFDSFLIISSRWRKFTNYIVDNNIKASIGVIGNSFEKGNFSYFYLIRSLYNSSYFEIWNHGYDHLLNVSDENGNVFSEFWNTSYENQKEHLLKTQKLVFSKTGITLRTFGAPGNAIDENTLKAIEEIDDIKIWYFGLQASSKLIIKRVGEIEFPTANPDFQNFLVNYDSNKDYLAFQIHPNKWEDDQFDQFKKIVNYLIEADVTFMNPYEYYTLLNPEFN